MIEFTRPSPMKKTCTMHPEKESVRAVSFTDFNGNSVTVTLCQMCLAELKMKAATEYRSMTEERAKQNRFKIGDHVYLEHLGVVSEIKTWKAFKWQTGQTQTESERLPLRKSQNIKSRGSNDGENYSVNHSISCIT